MDDDGTPDEYDDVFDALKIPKWGANIDRSADQNVPFHNCKHSHNDPTDGEYYALLNPKGKTITSVSNFSPMYRLKQKLGSHLPADWTERLPDVYRWSDVIWILWKDVAKEKAGDLKYIFKHNVITEQTRFIMEQTVGAPRDGLVAPWPGHEFRLGSNYFVALLGTLHGRGIVYLLIQHATGLAGKDLESITIFTDSYEGYNLLFTLTGPGN